MHKQLLIASTLLSLGAAPLLAQTKPATAPAPARTAMSGDADFAAMRDTRIEVVKAALQLRPDQQQYWPALESAIRARSEARERRIKQIEARMDKPGSLDPVQMLKTRADSLAQRSEALKKLADAWQPLYATLDNDQKRRMVIVAAIALREARNALDERMMEDDEDMEDF
jgi:hypothetical protein